MRPGPRVILGAFSGEPKDEAIAAAKGTAGRIAGAAEELRTIEEGKLADLLILDADPLQDIRNTRKIWRLLKGGGVFEPKEILELVEDDPK